MNCSNCPHPRDNHTRQRAEGKPALVLGGCLLCDCQKFTAEKEANRAKIAPADLDFVRWQIKQHQRMIHELRERHGLTE